MHVDSTVRRRTSLLAHDEEQSLFDESEASPQCALGEFCPPAVEDNTSSPPEFELQKEDHIHATSTREDHNTHKPHECGHHMCSRMVGEEAESCYEADSESPLSSNDLRRSSEDHAAEFLSPRRDACVRQTPGSTTAVSVESGHGGPQFGGTTKLTRKWPCPSTLKPPNAQLGCKSLGSLSSDPPTPSLEYGQGPALPHTRKWTPSKIWLFVSVMSVFTYGSTVLLCASVTWFDAWTNADVMVVADHDILVLITISATFVLLTSMLGISGTFLNSRPLLAIYGLLLWPDLTTILAIGYMAYKRVTFNLDRKLNFAWTRLYTVQGRQAIQDSLGCCGFYNTLHEAAPTKRCYMRAPIPGCRNALFEFERDNLTNIWQMAFVLAGIHILNVVVSLLCSNHVTDKFGKGLTPPRYRLCSDEVRAERQRIYGEVGNSATLEGKNSDHETLKT